MRGLARFVATSTLVIGCLAALVLVVAALNALDYGIGGALLLLGWAFGVFLTAGASACVLSLLASIDERLQAAGHAIPGDASSDDWKEDQSVFQEQFGAPGVKAGVDADLDADSESKSNFRRTQGRG